MRNQSYSDGGYGGKPTKGFENELGGFELVLGKKYHKKGILLGRLILQWMFPCS